MQTKRSYKCGFTLVEVIVVLVILAILAAIMIPAMTGWIDRAQEKSAIVGCRTCVLAAQTIADEQYATGTVNVTTGEVLTLADVKGSVDSVDIAKPAVVDTLTYTTPKSITVTYFRTKLPHYQVGMTSAGVSVGALTDAFKRVLKGGDLTVNGLSFGNTAEGTKIDGVNADKENTFAKVIFDALTPAQQAYLSGVSWSFVRKNGATNLYFTETRYEANSGTQTGVKVYEYDTKTGQYRYTESGTVIKGEVQTTGSDWTDWSDRMD